METHCSYISYEQTGFFSRLVIDYVQGAPQLQSFYNFSANIDGIKTAISQRQNFEHRKLLVQQLQKQYQGLTISEKASANIQLLSHEKTFTITTDKSKKQKRK